MSRHAAMPALGVGRVALTAWMALAAPALFFRVIHQFQSLAARSAARAKRATRQRA